MATKKEATTKKRASGAEYTPSKSTRITKDDIESLSSKLGKFAGELPKQEQDVLGWILTRAQAAPAAELAAAAATAAPEVPGLKTPLSAQLARSVGFARPAERVDVTVVVGWQYRFGLTELGDLTTNPIVRK